MLLAVRRERKAYLLQGGGDTMSLRDKLRMLLLWGQFLTSWVASQADGEAGWGLNGQAGRGLCGSTPMKGRMTGGQLSGLPKELTGRLAGASGGRPLWKEGRLKGQTPGLLKDATGGGGGEGR